MASSRHSILYLQACQDLCLTHGTAAGKYAGRLLKANCAARPKGCSACFVPQTHYEMQINWDFTLSRKSLQQRGPRQLCTKKAQRKALSFNLFAEREGFEPPDPLRSTVFKTAAFDHSAISPKSNFISPASSFFVKWIAKVRIFLEKTRGWQEKIRKFRIFEKI